MSQAKHCHDLKIASKIDSSNGIMSVLRNIERFLSNKWIRPEDNYLPFLQFFAPFYKDREKIYLLMDGTHAGKNKTLMVSFLYKDKVILLVWLSESGTKGNFKEDRPIELMAKALRALKGLAISSRVVLLGDGEFDGSNFRSFLEKNNCLFVSRTSCNRVFYNHYTEPFQPRDIDTDTSNNPIFISDVKDSNGPEDNLLISRANKKRKLTYLITNMDDGHWVSSSYAKRYKTETLFRDMKTKGFHSQKSQIEKPKHLDNLIIVMALAYICVLVIGTWVCTKDKLLWHLLGSKKLNYSLIQIGFLTLEHLEIQNQHFNNTS